MHLKGGARPEIQTHIDVYSWPIQLGQNPCIRLGNIWRIMLRT